MPLKKKKGTKNTQRGIAVACGGQAALAEASAMGGSCVFPGDAQAPGKLTNSVFSLGGMATGARSLPPQRTQDSVKLPRIRTREFAA